MEQHFKEGQSSEWGKATIPCPNPSAAAVEAGVFGFDEIGVIIPTSDDVRALTEEHARELYWILHESFHLRYCVSHGIDPVSGRAPRGSDQRLALLKRLERETHSLAQQYDDALAAYTDGFGLEAAEALDAFVNAALSSPQPETPPSWQRELF